jgi:Flp pilus assembly protein TadD
LPRRQHVLLAMAVLCTACTHRAATVRVPVAPSGVAATFGRQAINAIDQGDGDYQARTLRARLDASPQDLNARLELARHYQRAGFPEVAIEHLRLACEHVPESPEAHLALAKMLRGERRPAEAALSLRTFAAAHPGEAEIWAWLGVVEDEAGNWKAGETAHRKAIALAPHRADLRNNLGYCLLEQKRRNEAADSFRAALAIEPQSLIARNNLGLAVSDQPSEAVLQWQSAAGPATAHNNMAVALMEAGQYSEARLEIRKALDFDPHHAAALNNLRLLTDPDHKPAEIPATPQPQGRWAKMTAAWRHRWFGVNMANQQNHSGSPLASLEQGTN